MPTDLPGLKEITDTLTLNSMILSQHQEYVYYDVCNGTCFGIGVLKESGPHSVAVQKAFMSNGTEFPYHSHEETEYLVVYSGKIIIHKGEDDQVALGRGDAILIKPGQPHSVLALEDAWLIGITIPAAEGYPND